MSRLPTLIKQLCGGTTLAIAALTFSPGMALADEIRWQNQLFEQTVVDGDIRSVLRKVLEANGQSVIFRPDVEEQSITFVFKDMPLQAAFNKVMVEYDLDYEFDAASNTITISKKRQLVTGFELYSPEHVTLGDIRNALRLYKIKGAKIVYDTATGTMVMRGDKDAIAEILKVAQHIDKSAESRLAARLKQEELNRKRQLEQLQVKSIEQVVESYQIETDIIPLRYANVGSTTTSFQGEQVTIPGLEETLKSLLALSSDKPAGDAANAAAPGATQEFSISGQPARIAVDQRTNSVIVRGSRKVIEDIRSIVRDLDKEVPLVDIEVMIVQADAGFSRNLGVQWAYGRKGGPNNKNITGISTGNTAGQGVIDLADNANTNLNNVNVIDNGTTIATQTPSALDPITLLPLATFDNLVASFIYNGSSTFVQAQINALAEDNKAEIISSPHVVTLNNVAAKITSTDKLHVKIATKEGGEGDIKEIDAGLSLDITPSVFEGDIEGTDTLVRMNINATNSSFTGQFQTQEKEIQTQAILRDGSTFVLGGLFETRRVETEDGVPGLKSIPVLGALFRNRQSVDSRAETVFFITPKVVHQQQLLAADIGDRNKELRRHRVNMGRQAQSFMLQQTARIGKETEKLHSESPLLDMPALVEEDE